MKIIIVYPYFLDERIHSEDIRYVPMGAYYVGALLKEKGFDVQILNWHAIHKTPEKIRKTLQQLQPDVIGFSIVHANRWGGLEIARIAKELNPGVQVVFGGIGTTFLWEHLLSHFREIDYAVIGEGEQTFAALVGCLEKGHHQEIKQIRGIAFRENGNVTGTGSGEITADLDSLPMPARYFTFTHVSLTRGCPAHCAFCGSPRFWQHKVRFHSPDYFVRQLAVLYKKGVSHFFFSDDTFTLKKEMTLQVCKKIIERNLNITWVAISSVQYINEEVLYWMRRAGCTQISYGVESGSEKIRKHLKKNIRQDEIVRAFELTAQYGILARAYFIYGSPGENQDTIQESIDLMKQIRPLSVIFYILDIFPGTELYADFQKRTGASDEIWLKRIEDIMYFETDAGLDNEMVLGFGRMLRTAFWDSLPSFVEAIQLVDKQELYECHADFLSRLGMTFSHGDYASNEAIEDGDGIAERLFSRSLAYFPSERGYLGSAMMVQKKKAYDEAERILHQGLHRFPKSESLHLCMGINLLNQGEPAQALKFFEPFQDSPTMRHYMAECYNAMGEFQKARRFRDRRQSR